MSDRATTYYFMEESESGVGYDIYLLIAGDISLTVEDDDVKGHIKAKMTHVGKINDMVHAKIILNMLNNKLEKMHEVGNE